MRLNSSATLAAACAMGAATLAGPDELDAAGSEGWGDAATGLLCGGTDGCDGVIAFATGTTGALTTAADAATTVAAVVVALSTGFAGVTAGAVRLTGGAAGVGAIVCGAAGLTIGADAAAGAWVKTCSKRLAAFSAACGDVRSIVSIAIGFGSARRTGGAIGVDGAIAVARAATDGASYLPKFGTASLGAKNDRLTKQATQAPRKYAPSRSNTVSRISLVIDHNSLGV